MPNRLSGMSTGEMERDSAISHGASKFLQERLMHAANAYTTVACKNCGIIANNVASEKNYHCRLCDNTDPTGFGLITMPYTKKYLDQLLAGFGYLTRFTVVKEDEYHSIREKRYLESTGELNDVEEAEEEQKPEGVEGGETEGEAGDKGMFPDEEDQEEVEEEEYDNYEDADEDDYE